MKNETLFAQRLTAHLDEGLDDLPQHIQARLNLSRDLALAKVQSRKSSPIQVGQGILAFDFGFFRRRMSLATLAIALLASALGALQYNSAQESANLAADLDEEILSDDAPVQAYMDPAFTSVFHSGLLSKSAEK